MRPYLENGDDCLIAIPNALAEGEKLKQKYLSKFSRAESLNQSTSMKKTCVIRQE